MCLKNGCYLKQIQKHLGIGFGLNKNYLQNWPRAEGADFFINAYNVFWHV